MSAEMASPTNNLVSDLETERSLPKSTKAWPQQPQSEGPALSPEVLTTFASLNSVAGLPPVPNRDRRSLISWSASNPSSDKANSSCIQLASEHETQLKNLTLVNILILIVLIIVFIANAKEGKKNFSGFFQVVVLRQ